MNFRPASVAALAAVPLLLAGCSGGEPGGQAAPTSSPAPQSTQQRPDAPDARSVTWVNELCGAVGDFTAAQNQVPPPDKSSAEAFKASTVAQIEHIENAADHTVNRIEHLGQPPVQGAEKVGTTFRNGFAQVGSVLEAARTKAQQIDTSNRQAFTSSVGAVQAELQKGAALNFSDEFASFSNNPELSAAAERAPRCRALAASAQPKQPPQPQQPRPR